MRSNEDIKKEIESLKVILNGDRVSAEEKQIFRDKINELYKEISRNAITIESKIVPVETNNIVAHRQNMPASRFMNSHAFKI